MVIPRRYRHPERSEGSRRDESAAYEQASFKATTEYTETATE
jgi:hypothetical protein